MSTITTYRTCFVPQCTNTTKRTPNKIFATVPQNMKLREKWFKAAHRANLKKNTSNHFCCEDHFNLREDMENYQYYMMMGGPVKIRKGVVPHIFECQPDRWKSIVPRAASEKREREKDVAEILSEACENSSTDNVDNLNETTESADESEIFDILRSDDAIQYESEERRVPTSDEGARFSPSPWKTKFYCCVPGCLTNSTEEPTLRFHKFPTARDDIVIKNEYGFAEKLDRREAWKKAFVIENPTSNMRACSLHFKKTDYLKPDKARGDRLFGDGVKSLRLKKTAVPSCNLPTIQSLTRAFNLTRKFLKPEQIASFPVVEKVEIGITAMVTGSFTLRSCIKTDQDLIDLTGIESFEIFKRIVNLVHSVDPAVSRTTLSILEEIILATFVKLKQNLSYKSLAVLCRKPNARKCEEMVMKMLEVLSGCLEPVIYWPTHQDIIKNKRNTFRGLYEKVRVVLDCTEINIEKPRDIPCRIRTYSPYENDHTIKFVTGFSPFGTICYISEPYGGRMSHKAAFEKCDLIEYLDTADFIMVDKRFVVGDFCRDENTKYVTRINCLMDKKQLPNVYGLVTTEYSTILPDSESPKSKDVETTELVNQRIRSFKILNERLPTELVKKARNIITVICATVNLSSTFLKKHRFEM